MLRVLGFNSTCIKTNEIHATTQVISIMVIFLNLEHVKLACRGLVRQLTMKWPTKREMWNLLSKAQEVVCLNVDDQMHLG